MTLRHKVRCAAALTSVLLSFSAPAAAQDPTLEASARVAWPAPLPARSPETSAALAALVAQATTVRAEGATTLLPSGTLIDNVTWDGALLRVELTLPDAAGSWLLSPLDVETLGWLLAAPFRADDTFAGIDIQVRCGESGTYMPIGLLVPYAPNPDLTATEPAERPLPLLPGEPRGPVVQAARQPVGALTGVTIYTAGGHGWTADNVVDGGYTDNKWFLQRPETWEMIEDYGNIDQLNYFVNFAFNAGATIVPTRPVGWQPIEIVLDNDDPGVTYVGSWSDGSSSKYFENGATNSGIVYKFTSATLTESATARFTPTITVSDVYPVYCFTVAGSNRTLQTYRVAHSGGLSAITIDHRETGSGWIWLGSYYLEAGGTNYVEISNQSSVGGAIVADAIRWGDGMGDVVRPGPGTVSGYPRDQECSRYWAEALYSFDTIGFDSSIYNTSSDDSSDNVGTGARVGREMNQVPAGGIQTDRWKRVYLEFHTNASGGAARGQICLITTTGATTNQTQFATILSDEVDNDLPIVDDEFEHTWIDRVGSTYTDAYGAISTQNNSDEFDATLVELAFHDNQEDAELLRDPRVRSAMARACVHGIIRFLNTLPSSQVPLAFAPDTPRYFRVTDLGGGDVRLAWLAPLSDGARGDPATGYVVYQSTNGYGFGDAIVLGSVLNTTISGIPTGEIRYFRVAATNAGGESMPSEVLAVRRPAAGVADVLIVNGFDRLRRQINPTQTFTQPPDYAGMTFERQIWRASNAFDYIVEHAEALAANDLGFASCSNEAVQDLYVVLGDYGIVDWILGTESAEDLTFSATEQSRVQTFLNAGGALFVSGADVAYDLVNQSHGVSFCQDTLLTGYSANDANTYNVLPVAGGIFEGLSAMTFSPASGAAYDVREPDVLVARPGAQACLDYSGGTGGVAAVQFTGTAYNVVTFGFPFEAIGDAATRTTVMDRVMDFLATASGPLPFDYNGDHDVDFQDFQFFALCMKGPDKPYAAGHICIDVPGESDLDIDLADFSLMQAAFTGVP